MKNLQYFYATPPQDFFDGMVSLAKLIREKSITIDYDEKDKVYPHIIDNYELLKIVVTCAFVVSKKGSHWEGDIRGEDIYLFSLPDPDNCSEKIGIVWKQENNGTTFICSPVELPWLSNYEI